MLQVGDLELDSTHFRVTRAGRLIDLAAKEFALLSLLMERVGQVVSRDVIGERIWPTGIRRNSNCVNVLVRRLRLKVDDPFSHRLIHTIRGGGYSLRQLNMTPDG